MYKRLSLVSALALGSVLILGNGLSRAVAQEKTIAEMVPKSGWTVARIDSNANTPEGYCALSRKYDRGLVLTLGRNEAEEYSLAIDFQAISLNTEKAYSLTLQPGPGQIRAYEMMPASKSAMVVRLGYDDSFFQALEASNLLKAEIDGTNYHFQMSDFSAGKADLNNCLSGLKSKSTTKVASGFSAEKVTDITPIIPKKIETAKVEPKPTPIVEPMKVAEVAPEAAVEMEKPAKPFFSKAIEITRVETEQAAVETPVKKAVPKPIEITRVKTKQVATDAPARAVSIKSSESVVRSNNDSLLKKSLASQKTAKKVSKQVKAIPSAQQAVRQTALQKQQRDALEQLKADNERLNKALRAEVSKPAPPPVVDNRAVEKLKTENQELKRAMQAQKQMQESEKAKLALAVQGQARKEKAAQDKIEKAQAEQKRLLSMASDKAEEEKISKDVDAPQKVAAVNPEVMRQLDDLKAENNRLSAALSGQQKKLSSFDAMSPEAEKELSAIRAQLHELQQENKTLYEDSRQARGQVDEAVFETGKQALSKMREYEKKLDAARNDNLSLSKEIEELRLAREDGRLTAVAGDWDLEKSTKRYNEAEREIKRLGMLLEQQRMAHRQEKSELEGMLFDPAVTDREQRRRLSDLELQLADAEKELQATGRRLPQRQRVAVSPVEERVTLGSLSPDPVVSRQRENLEIQRLNNKVARQNRQLQAYNRQQTDGQTERMVAVPKPVVSELPLMSPRDVARKSSARPAPTLVEPPQAVSRVASQSQAPKQAPRSPMVEAVSNAPQKMKIAGFSQAQLQQLLSSAGVPLSGSITKQAVGRYRWSAGSLVGTAKVMPQAQAGNMEQFTQNYISKARQSCGGDFASLPSTAGGQGKAFEIACISPSRSTSSSVIFIQKGNEFIAISHESSAENMDTAMDARDRIAASL